MLPQKQIYTGHQPHFLRRAIAIFIFIFSCRQGAHEKILQCTMYVHYTGAEIANYSVMQSAVSQLKSGNHIATRGC